MIVKLLCCKISVDMYKYVPVPRIQYGADVVLVGIRYGLMLPSVSHIVDDALQC
jgi:hypothetical protein